MSDSSDLLTTLLRPKFDARLKSHLSSVDLTHVSRLSPDRLSRTALPNIGLIELVSGDVFATKYQALYETLFHGGERERSTLIVDRLAQDFAGKRDGLAPYRVIGFRDHEGDAIAAAQFSVLPIRRYRAVVPYLQYIYVRKSSRRQDMSELLHALILGVAIADAGEEKEKKKKKMVPLFTLFETEPPGHTAVAGERTRIHAKGGSVAMMLREKNGRVDGRRVRSAHVQPGLEIGELPITLVWVLRPNPESGKEVDGEIVREQGEAAIGAYYQSLRDEGFPEENIALSERMVAKRMEGCELVVMPLAEITTEMYKNID